MTASSTTPAISIEVVRVPSRALIALRHVAPLVRRGVITDTEGRALVEMLVRRAWMESA